VDPSRIAAEFPAPSYRGQQRPAIERIRGAFQAGNEVVLVRAPTGSGKSLLARAIAGAARQPGSTDSHRSIGAYYTTPQVSQLDEVAADPLLSDLSIIRGKSNYTCLLPGDTNTPVDRAPCAREQGFDCAIEHRCPYFSDRAIAANSPIAGMTLAYFMQTAGSEIFGPRDVVVIDEAHGLAEWAELYATIELSPRRVPAVVWEATPPPALTSISEMAAYATRLRATCQRRQREFKGELELTPAETAERDRLAELVRDLGWFLDDVQDLDSGTTWILDQAGGAESAVSVKPMDPAGYLRHTVWDRGSRFALLSATILDKRAFCRATGLDPSTVALVDVSHTFPVANRPLYDVTQGKMTYEHREQTLPKIARLVVRLMQHHPEEKGLVHAHSYGIAEALVDRLEALGVGGRVRTHDREGRDAALGGWLRSSDADVFVSVTMEEALDLEGDACRWQVLCKAPFPNTRDARVEARLADGQWGWYYRAALRTVIQACGRVVRAPDDNGATYLADSSLLDLFDRAAADTPEWFQAQVDAITSPALPAFEPAAAVGQLGGAVTGGDAERSATSTRSGDRSDPDDVLTEGSSRRHGGRSSEGPGEYTDHPLSDVWGEDG
jgi:Rad3-related DNA helicase